MRYCFPPNVANIDIHGSRQYPVSKWKSRSPFFITDLNYSSAQKIEHQYWGIKENYYEALLMPSCSFIANPPPHRTNNTLEGLHFLPSGNAEWPSHSTYPYMTDFDSFPAQHDLVINGLLQFNERTMYRVIVLWLALTSLIYLIFKAPLHLPCWRCVPSTFSPESAHLRIFRISF